MSVAITSAKGSTVVIIGDACLFTAAAFCLLAIAGGPLALVIGPAAAWLLHGRRLDRAAAGSGIIGIVIGIVAVAGFFGLVPWVMGAIEPVVGGGEFTAPVALLATVGAAFLALLVGLDIDSIRDLLPARRRHICLDAARLIATLIIAIFVAIVSLVQAAYPSSEIGEAGIFALGAAAAGAVTMLAGNAVYTRWEQRRGG